MLGILVSRRCCQGKNDFSNIHPHDTWDHPRPVIVAEFKQCLQFVTKSSGTSSGGPPHLTVGYISCIPKLPVRPSHGLISFEPLLH